jgi:hypothetical protein
VKLFHGAIAGLFAAKTTVEYLRDSGNGGGRFPCGELDPALRNWRSGNRVEKDCSDGVDVGSLVDRPFTQKLAG